MYDKESIRIKVRELIINSLNIDENELNKNGSDDINLELFGYNSIDALEMIIKLENEFKCEFDDENLNYEFIKSLNSITDYVTNQLNESAGRNNQKHKTEPIVIGITGGSGSGKSTLCNIICKNLPTYSIKVISTDNFFIDPLPKTISPVSGKLYDDWNSPSSIDKTMLIESVKQAISEMESSEVVIVEGLSALYFEELRNLYSLKIFVDLDLDERMYRRIQRNIKMWDTTVEEVATYYLEMAKYREREYFLNTKDYADIVLNGNRLDGVSLDMISAWIIAKLQQ